MSPETLVWKGKQLWQKLERLRSDSSLGLFWCGILCAAVIVLLRGKGRGEKLTVNFLSMPPHVVEDEQP